MSRIAFNRGFEGPGLSLWNLGRGDVEGAYQAWLDPEQLSPYQLGLADETGRLKERDPLTETLRTVGPIIAFGAVLAIGFPTPVGRRLVKWGKNLTRYTATLIPGLRHLMSPAGILRGTPLGREVQNLWDRVRTTNLKLIGTWGKHVERFYQRTGRLPDIPEQIATAMTTEGLHNGSLRAGRQSWAALRGTARKTLYLTKHGGTRSALRKQFGKTWVDPEIERLIDRLGVANP